MKDKNDERTLRHSRDRHLGISISSEYYQRVPMFFTREAKEMELIGHYRGASAFLICNGPSFASLDHSLLRKPGIITYGMNNGAKSFRPNFWTCVDDPSRFLYSIWTDPCILKIIPFDHFEKRLFDNEKWAMSNIKVGDCPNVVGFRRNEKFVANRFLFEDTFNWGNHKDYGGGRSVMLPCLRALFLMGFRKVYLLGCDFNMSEEYTYHFDEQRAKGAVNCNKSTYKRLQDEYFPQLKPVFDEEGFKVYNCYKESGLKAFPYISFEDAIKETTKSLGDVEKERTWGLYDKPGEKSQTKVEPPEEEKKNLKKFKELRAIGLKSQMDNIQKQLKEMSQEIDMSVSASSAPSPLAEQLADHTTNQSTQSTNQSQLLPQEIKEMPQPETIQENVGNPQN